MKDLGYFLVFIGFIGLMLLMAYMIFIKVGFLASIATLCIEAIVFGGIISD